ncbi:hypothetical protein D3C87_1373510 [compost metagenome]
MGRRIEIAGDDADDLASGDPDHDLADRIDIRIGLAIADPAIEMAYPVGQDVAALGHRAALDWMKRGIGFEARDDAAALRLQGGPPGKIVVAEVEDIGGSGFDGHGLGGGDVVDIGGGDDGIDGCGLVGIVDDMDLTGAAVCGKAGPVG